MQTFEIALFSADSQLHPEGPPIAALCSGVGKGLEAPETVVMFCLAGMTVQQKDVVLNLLRRGLVNAISPGNLMKRFMS